MKCKELIDILSEIDGETEIVGDLYEIEKYNTFDRLVKIVSSSSIIIENGKDGIIETEGEVNGR